MVKDGEDEGVEWVVVRGLGIVWTLRLRTEVVGMC